MDRPGHDATRDNVIGAYAHAGLGLILGLILGMLVATLFWHHISLGLALGVSLGLILEVVFEVADRRGSHGPRRALQPVHELRMLRRLRRRHRTAARR